MSKFTEITYIEFDLTDSALESGTGHALQYFQSPFELDTSIE